MYGTGISRTGEVLDLAVDLDIIKKGGSWFSYKDQKLGQGRDNVKELLKNDEALMKEIEEQILARKDELHTKPSKEKKNAKNGEKVRSLPRAKLIFLQISTRILRNLHLLRNNEDNFRQEI